MRANWPTNYLSILFYSFLFLPVVNHAQTTPDYASQVSWTDEHSVPQWIATTRDIENFLIYDNLEAGRLGNGMVVVYRLGGGIVQRHLNYMIADQNMEQLGEGVLKFKMDGEKVNVIAPFIFQENFLLLGWVFDEDAQEATLRLYSADLFNSVILSGWKTIGTISHDSNQKAPRAAARISEDGERLLIYSMHQSTLRDREADCSFWVFDKDFMIQTERTERMPFTFQKARNFYFQINNEGHINGYAYRSDDEDNAQWVTEMDKYSYVLTSLQPGQPMLVSETPISQMEGLPRHFFGIGEQSSLFVQYSRGQESQKLDQFQLMRVDNQSLETFSNSSASLPEEMLKTSDGHFRQWSRHRSVRMHPEVFSIGDYEYLVGETKGGMTFGPLIIAQLDAENEVVDFHLIEKSQDRTDREGVFSSFVVTQARDRLFMLFGDNIANYEEPQEIPKMYKGKKAAIVLTELLPDGTIHTHLLSNDEDRMKETLYTVGSGEIEPGVLLLMDVHGNNIRLGLLDLN